jgi:DNA-directed RNA polymerase specialized sigma24 family protein
VKPGDKWGDHEKALRRFAAALVRDDRIIRDDRAAMALAEPLIRQTLLAFSNSEGQNVDSFAARELLFAQFIRRYHRHLRMIAADDEDFDWTSWQSAARPADLRLAISRLPLELREAILLVVVEGFSHVEAAATLEAPLAVVTERLAAARRILSGAVGRKDTSEPARWPVAPHLRLIK